MSPTYEVLTARGVLVATFSDAALAKRHVLAMKKDVPGLMIDRVETVIQRSAVYRPRRAKQVRAA